MKYIRFITLLIIAVLASNLAILNYITNGETIAIIHGLIALLIAFLLGTLPRMKLYSSKKLNRLAMGVELLTIFVINLIFSILFFLIGWLINKEIFDVYIALVIAIIILFEIIIFWRGMIKIYTTSTQLGIKHRVLAIVFSFLPPINFYYLIKMIIIVNKEVNFEDEKIKLNQSRKVQKVCQTKYPILLVHGVFFRDFRYLDYWGRIPKELKENGAIIYYGSQQSAASVEECGKELAEKIKEIVKTTGCKKVNIIGHSKGGLDARAAISHYNVDKYVASLTTINTPHNGCLFAEYLLGEIKDPIKNKIAGAYNKVLKKLGDKNPDFISAVNDLTNTSCLERNKTTPNKDGILYESVMSYCKRRTSGKFPLNISYPVVKKYDGQNDGLVGTLSAKWGSNFTLLAPTGKRGISHGDMIDLNRENIDGFDVREFYVKLVESLKKRGY